MAVAAVRGRFWLRIRGRFHGLLSVHWVTAGESATDPELKNELIRQKILLFSLIRDRFQLEIHFRQSRLPSKPQKACFKHKQRFSSRPTRLQCAPGQVARRRQVGTNQASKQRTADAKHGWLRWADRFFHIISSKISTLSCCYFVPVIIEEARAVEKAVPFFPQLTHGPARSRRSCRRWSC